jgi:hypothetical protein
VPAAEAAGLVATFICARPRPGGSAAGTRAGENAE